MLAYSHRMELTHYVLIAYLLTAALLGLLCVVSSVQHYRVRRALTQHMARKDRA